MNIRNKSLGKRWARHIYRTLTASDGWRLAGKILALFLGFIAFMLPVITYQSSTRAAIFERTYNRLNDFREKIQSPDSEQRANGLKELPSIIALRAHENFDVGPMESFSTLIGLSGEGKTILADHVRQELLAYLASTGKTGLSKNETIALFDTLKRLGKDGWINGNPILETPDDKKAWSWIWNDNKTHNKEVEKLCHAFTGISMQGADFYDVDLCFIDLCEARLTNFKISESLLRNSKFDMSNFNRSEFDKALMDISSLKEAIFTDCDLRGCSVNSSELQEAIFNSCVLLNIDFSNGNSSDQTNKKTILSRCRFIDCMMSEINFRGAVLAGISFEAHKKDAIAGSTASNFYEADLSNANMVNANFEDSDFSYSDLSGAIARKSKLRYCTFNNAVLDYADFSGADLTGTEGLCPTDNVNGMAVKSCKGLNISDIKGLTTEQITYLLQQGAKNT